jgi:hypothetical protein
VAISTPLTAMTAAKQSDIMTIQGYDLVGDIHGHADALHRLLRELEYTEVDGVFRNPQRKMIFVGDFIDRGPQQREVLRIARSMCEAGAASAVMGNHEFNAIGWADQNEDGGFLRSHSEKNARQHAKFLHQIDEASADHKDAVRWFRSLPIWLDLPGLRAVHACWHEPSCQALMPFLDEAGRLTEEGIQESYRHGSDAHSAIEILLKGPEERLPAGIHFFDKDGHKREEVRLRWWDHGATTFRKAALGMDGREDEIPDSKIPTDYRYHESKPVFFGHYWLTGQPGITAPNAACLDFSVAKEGYLTTYRWSGERELTEDSLVAIPA